MDDTQLRFIRLANKALWTLLNKVAPENQDLIREMQFFGNDLWQSKPPGFWKGEPTDTTAEGTKE